MSTQQETALIRLKALFDAHCKSPMRSLEALPAAGSDRQYYRFWSEDGQSFIGTYHTDSAENRNFVHFAKHFSALGLAVPAVLAEDLEHGVYLQADLGNQSLLDLLEADKKALGSISETTIELYRSSLRALAKLQVKGMDGLDLSQAINGPKMEYRQYLADLNYFKYYFAKANKLAFDEHDLDKDFEQLASLLDQAPKHFFLFRDFQARNIMVHEGKPWFIDFQGGKAGALPYDVVSLLFQAKAGISPALRDELLDVYLDELALYTPVDREQFRREYPAFVLSRMLQVLGSYGFRGIFERRPHFLASIPGGLENLSWFVQSMRLPIALPSLEGLLQKLIEPAFKGKYNQITAQDDAPLEVQVCSFSYLRRGVPVDESQHRGGFVFDCRSIHNPGRYEPYKALTGKDLAVVNFLKTNSDMDAFLKDVFSMVDRAVEVYLQRKFDHLSISFGCTGGQHRSVYAAEQTAKHLRERYGLKLQLQHLEQDHWPSKA